LGELVERDAGRKRGRRVRARRRSHERDTAHVDAILDHPVGHAHVEADPEGTSASEGDRQRFASIRHVASSVDPVENEYIELTR
jgi:hypothetical protein